MLNQGSTPTKFGRNNLPNGVYNVVVYGCDGNFEYSQTPFSINGVTQSALATTDGAFVQNNNYVVFTNVAVTNGTISGTWREAGTVEAALNGLQVQLGYS